MRRENEQEYKKRKYEFIRKREGEQIFIVEIAVPWNSKLQEAVIKKKEKYRKLMNQLGRNGAEVSMAVVVIGALGTVEKETIERLEQIRLDGVKKESSKEDGKRDRQGKWRIVLQEIQ